jgi:hypothetical protein
MAVFEIDEIQAFEMAIAHARKGGAEWLQPFWIVREKDTWDVGASSEAILSIDAKSGNIVAPDNLDAIRAFALAKQYAASNQLSWKPMFTVEWRKGCWCVGSSQSQLGGQCYINFDREMNVVGHVVNPK